MLAGGGVDELPTGRTVPGMLIYSVLISLEALAFSIPFLPSARADRALKTHRRGSPADPPRDLGGIGEVVCETQSTAGNPLPIGLQGES